MNDIPGLRLAPLRMIALVGQGDRQLGSVSPTSTPADRHAAGSSDPPAFAAKPVELQERTIASSETTPAVQTRVARFTSSHAERTGDAYDAPENEISFEISFGDFLDIINPLQHIPIVGTIYRAVTGDEISPTASIFGGFLFGGPLGFVTAISGAIFEEASGQDLGETVLAALVGDDAVPDIQMARIPSANSTAASLEITAPTGDSQALGTAAATASTTRKAGDNLGSSENLTGQRALGAFARDLRQFEQLARTAPVTTTPGVPVAIQARAPDARRLDPRAMEATLPANALAERMSHALDKYQAIARKAERNGNDHGLVLDTRL